MFNVPQQLGIEALKGFCLRAMDLARIDRNQDGKIDAQEWGQAVFGLLPELLNIKQLTSEVKDLTKEEISEIVLFVAQNFPDYPNVKNEVEDIVRASLKWLGNVSIETYELLHVITASRKKAAQPSAPKLSAAATAKKAAKKAAGADAKAKDLEPAE